MLVLGLHSKGSKSIRDKANKSNPKVNRVCPPLTANRTSADCVQISLGPSKHIPLRVYHTGGFNAMCSYLVNANGLIRCKNWCWPYFKNVDTLCTIDMPIIANDWSLSLKIGSQAVVAVGLALSCVFAVCRCRPCDMGRTRHFQMDGGMFGL